jgi:hypothetical protein
MDTLATLPIAIDTQALYLASGLNALAAMMLAGIVALALRGMLRR